MASPEIIVIDDDGDDEYNDYNKEQSTTQTLTQHEKRWTPENNDNNSNNNDDRYKSPPKKKGRIGPSPTTAMTTGPSLSLSSSLSSSLSTTSVRRKESGKPPSVFRGGGQQRRITTYFSVSPKLPPPACSSIRGDSSSSSCDSSSSDSSGITWSSSLQTGKLSDEVITYERIQKRHENMRGRGQEEDHGTISQPQPPLQPRIRGDAEDHAMIPQPQRHENLWDHGSKEGNVANRWPEGPPEVIAFDANQPECIVIDDDDDDQLPYDRHDQSSYTSEELRQMLDEVGKDVGYPLSEVEKGSLVRADNRVAQYGRLLPNAVHRLLTEVMSVERDDVFIDYGHGIGTIVLQAAYTIGCESRGIEMYEKRNMIACALRSSLDGIHREKIHLNGRVRSVGSVTLRKGSLEDFQHHDYLTAGTNGKPVKAFVNNFGGVFGPKTAKVNHNYCLDNYVVGLFASMKPGSVMVTLEELTLPCSSEEMNIFRERNGFARSSKASFYSMEKLNLGPANETVTWSLGHSKNKQIVLYKYTRTQQGTSDGKAVILCGNPKCEKARDGDEIPAIKLIKERGGVRVVTNDCECKHTAKKLRVVRAHN